MMLMPSREVRIIPRGWQHPLENGRAIGLCPRSYLDEPDEDAPLTESDCMPDVDGLLPEQTQIAAYETVSEGTPISPAFDNTPEGKLALLSWVAANCDVPGFRDRKTDIEAWAAILFGAALVDIETGAVTA